MFWKTANIYVCMLVVSIHIWKVFWICSLLSRTTEGHFNVLKVFKKLSSSLSHLQSRRILVLLSKIKFSNFQYFYFSLFHVRGSHSSSRKCFCHYFAGGFKCIIRIEKPYHAVSYLLQPFVRRYFFPTTYVEFFSKFFSFLSMYESHNFTSTFVLRQCQLNYININSTASF